MASLTEVLQIAVQHHRANRLGKAEQIYRQVLARQPQNPDALHGLGVLAQQVGQHQNAEKLFNTLLRLQPESFKAWFSLGNVCQTQGRLAEAAEAYRKALAIQPSSVAVHNNLGYTLQLQGKLEEAIFSYQTALNLQPNCTEADVNLGMILYEQDKLSLEQKAYYALLNNELGLAHKKAGDLKNATTYYQQAIQLNPELAIAHYNLGVALQEQNKLKEAITAYQQALQFIPAEETIYKPLISKKLEHLIRQQNYQETGNTQKKLKVAFISQPFVMTAFPRPMDSIGILTYEIVRLLAAENDITVYAPAEEFREDYHENVQYRYIPVGLDKTALKYLEKYPGFKQPKSPIMASQYYYLGYILQIANELKKQDYDVVHVHNLSQFVPILRLLNPDIKIVLHMHCEWLSQLDYKRLKNRLLQADLIISPSDYITQAVQQRFPPIAERCKTVYNGVNISRFINSSTIKKQRDSDANTVKRLLFVGRISPEKGSHILLEAFEKVLETYPQAKLTLAGPVGVIPYEYLVALSDDKKIKELTHFHQDNSWLGYLKRKLFLINGTQTGTDAPVNLAGLIPPNQLANYYQQSDVFVFPSVCHEAFGMPLAEAMVAGIPVVSSDGGAFPELVEHEKTGLIVERSNSDALAKAIIQLLSDASLREKMGNLGCETAVNRFSFEQVTEDLLAQYQQLF
jgi:glycosyltransferase involved in cell wall biosynthesis/Flp pilus assembly protein TadD